jgi:hypothetical protein
MTETKTRLTASSRRHPEAKQNDNSPTFWRVRVCIPGSIIHLTSATEPLVHLRDGRIADVEMQLVTTTPDGWRHCWLHRLVGGLGLDVACDEAGGASMRKADLVAYLLWRPGGDGGTQLVALWRAIVLNHSSRFAVVTCGDRDWRSHRPWSRAGTMGDGA